MWGNAPLALSQSTLKHVVNTGVWGVCSCSISGNQLPDRNLFGVVVRLPAQHQLGLRQAGHPERDTL